MKLLQTALAALALTGLAAVPAQAAKPKARAKASTRPAKPAAPPVAPSADAARVIAWVGAEADNRNLPFVVVDKQSARAFLFDRNGKRLTDGPVLIGQMPGDKATPGVGAKSLSEIGPAEKTTPAGRYLARFGLAAGRQRVLWVDYATSVAMHTIPPANAKNRKENRRARMLSETIADNRVTFGCINVPIAFNRVLEQQFARKGGYVYIMPDEKPLEQVFPRIRRLPYIQPATEAAS